MIKRLRWQFIGVASIALIIVLTTVIGVINTAIYSRATDRLDTTLDYIVNYGGTLPKKHLDDSDDIDYVTPETAYETRYFSVVFDSNGKVTSTSMKQIAAISKEEAIKYSRKILNSEDGTIKKEGMTYFYKVSTNSDGSKLVVFVDATSQMTFVNTIKSLSMWLGAVSFVVFFLLLCLFSGQAIRPIIRSQEQQKQFITNAGHELKTPLAVISANTEVMEMLNGKNEWTQSNMKQVKRLSGLVAELVTIARLDEREDIIMEYFNYSETVKSVTEDFQPVAQSNDLSLVSDIEENVQVKGDKKTLHELVNILVDNAIKYCDENGQVSVTLHKGRKVQLRVSNNYKDGAHVDYSRFFERFYREDESHTSSSKKGYGIGLSMAESIVRASKGKISVNWKDGIITFEVLL